MIRRRRVSMVVRELRGLGWKAVLPALCTVLLVGRAAFGAVGEGAFSEASPHDVGSGSASMSLGNARPGDSVTACITVGAPATSKAVHLYGETEGADLAPYLDLVVTVGTMPEPSPGSCDGFKAQGSVDDETGAEEAIYRGTLEGFPDEYAGALRIPVPDSAELSRATGQLQAYRFEVALQDDNAAQGKSAVQTFIWEASA